MPVGNTAESVRRICTCKKERRSARFVRVDLSGSARCGGDGTAYGSQPAVSVGLVAAGQGKKFVLQLACDGAGYTFTDGDVSYRADGGNFHGGAHEENFVNNVKHLPGDNRFLYRNADIFSDLDDSVACDSRKNTGSERRRVEGAI